MKKKEVYNKKNLRRRLATIMTIYLDGLEGKRKKNFDKYLDGKLNSVVDYYVSRLKKKERKNGILPPPVTQMPVPANTSHALHCEAFTETIAKQAVTEEAGDSSNYEIQLVPNALRIAEDVAV